MKIKSLIKLICLLVVVAALGVWAFGANVSLLGTKFIAWDENMLKGNDIGMSNVTVYSISAPENVNNFDTHAAAINAVDVFNKRAELMGYSNASIRLMGKDRVFVALPLKEAQLYGGIGLFAYNGKLVVTKGSETVFTDADVKSAKVVGGESLTDSVTYYVDVTFENEAKAKLKELTSNGAYTFTFALDTDVAKATATGSETVNNGKLTLSFTDYNAASTFVLCVNSGAVDGTIEWSESADIISGTAGENATKVLALACLAILIVAALYFILSNKMLGVAATLSMLIAFIGYEFYAATFPWISVNAGAVAGILVSIIFIIFAHILVLNNVSKQYASGKDVVSALDTGVKNSQGIILEISIVAIVLGIALWIADGGFAPFGVALIGGAVVALVSSMLIVKFVAKIFMGLGADSAKAFGLKRGE